MSTISEVLGRRVQLKGLIGKRAMKCPYCDFYFMKNGSDLQRHIWAHEGEHPPRAERPSVCSEEALSLGLLQSDSLERTEERARQSGTTSDLHIASLVAVMRGVRSFRALTAVEGVTLAPARQQGSTLPSHAVTLVPTGCAVPGRCQAGVGVLNE